MSDYLRDRYIRSVRLNPGRIRAISAILTGFLNAADHELPGDDSDQVRLRYMIRFDNKGFVVDDIESILEYYRNSQRTERINFIAASDTFRKTNGFKGKSIDIRFDALNDGNCTMTIQDDDGAWVDAVFCRLDEELKKFGTKNFLLRTRWSPLLVQVFGLLTGFSVSLWAALRIAPQLNVEYAFLVSFVLAFLVFSNIWSYLNQQILIFLNYLFPNVSFKDDRGLRWLGQAFVGAVFVAVAFFVIDRAFAFLGALIDEIVK
ncbi:MAG: hypothetical protein WD448_07935 [Woeseia sp.]